LASCGKTCLVIAPHQDDETLGCGGVIARLTQAGDRAIVVFVTDGGACQLAKWMDRDAVVALRRQEAEAACAALGVPPDDLVFLNVADGKVGELFDSVAERIGAVIDRYAPTILFAPFIGDDHRDHRGIAEIVAGLVKAGRIPAPVFQYPVWLPVKSVLRLLGDQRFRANLYRVRIGDVVDRKKTALSVYASQTTQINGMTVRGALSERFAALFLGKYEVFFRLSGTPTP
jgi:LmbE family N-acetylglucosaminyl deacetylase